MGGPGFHRGARVENFNLVRNRSTAHQRAREPGHGGISVLSGPGCGGSTLGVLCIIVATQGPTCCRREESPLTVTDILNSLQRTVIVCVGKISVIRGGRGHRVHSVII